MLRKEAVIFTSVVLLAAANAKALGLGEVTLDSALNQPLNARIELLQLDGVALDQINVQMASEDDFGRLAIDRHAFLDNIRFSLDSSGSGSYILLSSVQAVHEPSLRFVLETRWPAGRLLSEHSVRLEQTAFGEGAAAAIQQAGGGGSFQNPQSEPPRHLAAAEADAAVSITVGANDTLWDIALAVRPDSSVSVQQTMLALQRLNREAFIGDNINMVRNGQVLRIPGLAEIRTLDSREAINEVSRQNQLFDNRRNVPLTAQPLTAQPDPASNAALNRGELRVVTSDDSAPDTDVSQSVGTRTAEMDARIRGLEDQLAVQQEEADRVTLQNEELSERLGMLEQQIASAREIIRLRDLELAQLQQALASAEVATPSNAVQAGAVATAPGAGGVEGAGSDSATAENAAADSTVVTMAPERSPLQRLLDSIVANTYLLLAVAALVVLLLVFALLRRRTDVEEEELAGTVDEEAIINIDDTAADESDAVAAFAADAGEDEVPAAVAPDLSDPVERADALICKADYESAIAVLRDAIVVEPHRTDLRLKLLEVYVATQDAIGFKLQETELRDLSDASSVAPQIAALRAHLRSEVDDEILEEGEDVFLQENELDPLSDLEANLDLEASATVDDDLVRSGYRIDAEAEKIAAEEELDFEDDVDVATGAATVDTASPEFDLASPVDEYDDLQFLDGEISDEDLAAELEEEDELSFLSGVDEAATKLDLARAYIEMGDQEGAREILEEVVIEGSAAQIEDARTLLAQL